ncbi:EamA/RhaT family transporter, partial [Klebsiella pneumoniae]|nr:EamA/RhaT family transporter [Klebsiella pneumoniae]
PLPARSGRAVGRICVHRAERRQGRPNVRPGRSGSGIALALGSGVCWAWAARRNARWRREHPHPPPLMWATAPALVTL